MKTVIQYHRNLVSIPSGSLFLRGTLQIPTNAKGAVVFVPASGCCHDSPLYHYIAQVLQQAGLASLLVNFLTPEEEDTDRRTRYCLRHSTALLSERLLVATDWLKQFWSAPIKVGYFASSAGACAALAAAAKRPDAVAALVSCSGYLDLVGPVLANVQAPTLLIVGEQDFLGVGMNQDAIALLQTEKHLEIVREATHSFTELGVAQRAAQLARDWFISHLQSA
ncbi:MAG: dienelactone hydrolase family protein [Cyanophyceae cyanobacterium]